VCCELLEILCRCEPNRARAGFNLQKDTRLNVRLRSSANFPFWKAREIFPGRSFSLSLALKLKKHSISEQPSKDLLYGSELPLSPPCPLYSSSERAWYSIAIGASAFLALSVRIWAKERKHQSQRVRGRRVAGCAAHIAILPIFPHGSTLYHTSSSSSNSASHP